MLMYSWVSIHTDSEQFIWIDFWYWLSPVTERAVLWHYKGLVLLFAQQREHVLHQLTQSAIAAKGEKTKPEKQSEQENGYNI